MFIILVESIILSVLQQLGYFNPPILRYYAHHLVNFVLWIRLLYRTNSSYDRFHEGRRQWGSIVNNCRNLIRFIRTIDREIDIKQLLNITAAYCFSLKERLRGVTKLDDYLCLLLGEKQVQFVENANNKPVAIITLISDWI
jgi:putative membrane protein